MREPALPNFFIVGTGKGGTTSLYHYLRQHPQIFMSPIKEPCYFASEIRLENLTPAYHRHIQRMSRKLPKVLGDGKPVKALGWLISEWEDYVRLFQDVQGQTAVGEASAAYLWSATAAGKIAACRPHARIVMILRDPAERAFSQYLHQLAVGLTHSTFRDHIRKCMRDGRRKIGVHYPLLEVGLYHEQVKRYFEQFSQNKIRVYWYEEMWCQPGRLFQDLFQFLNVDSSFRPDTSRKSLERQAPRFPAMNKAVKRFDIVHRFNEVVPPTFRLAIRKFLFRPRHALKMDARDRQYLIDYYREDVTKLALLVNRDLSAWLA